MMSLCMLEHPSRPYLDQIYADMQVDWLVGPKNKLYWCKGLFSTPLRDLIKRLSQCKLHNWQPTVMKSIHHILAAHMCWRYSYVRVKWMFQHFGWPGLSARSKEYVCTLHMISWWAAWFTYFPNALYHTGKVHMAGLVSSWGKLPCDMKNCSGSRREQFAAISSKANSTTCCLPY